MKRKRNQPHPLTSYKSEQNSESDITTEDEDKTNTTETHQFNNVLTETTHDEENVSEAEDNTSQEENVIEMQIYENNREQNKQEDKLLTTNFEVKVKNRKIEGLITYSTDQQIFKFKVNSPQFLDNRNLQTPMPINYSIRNCPHSPSTTLYDGCLRSLPTDNGLRLSHLNCSSRRCKCFYNHGRKPLSHFA